MKRVNRARPEPRPSRLNGATVEEREFARLTAHLPDAAPDDLLVERVWRRLRMPDPGPSHVGRWLAASAMMLVLIATAGWWWIAAAQTRAQVLVTAGGVFLTSNGATWVPARHGDSLSVGALLRSDTAGRGVAVLPGVAALLLGPDADLSFDRLGRATEFGLGGGSVTFRVTKRPHDRPFVVHAGDYAVTVVGTLFSVSEASNGRVEVSVSEGVVEVSGKGDRWRVEAGHSWNSERQAEQGPGGIAATKRALLTAALDASPTASLTDLLQAVAGPAAPPPSAASVMAAPETVAGPASAKPAGASELPEVRGFPPQPHVRAERAPHHPPPALLARIDPTPHASTFEPPVVVLAPANLPPNPAPSPAPPTAVVPAPRDYYVESLNLARQGDHQKAAAVLEQALAAGSGPRDLELYQLAVLRQRYLGDPQGALDALQGYRTQFPHGALRQEVDLSLVEVNVALGHTEAALTESARFLAQHPQSERADEVRVLRGDLLRQRGDFLQAAGEYRAVSGGAALDDALYYWAYCRQQLGDGASAARALRDYVSRFPEGRHASAAREALGQ
jgi:ferric-dicitrate binding protein FerR (iron transport regulator)/TolA-binding protein